MRDARAQPHQPYSLRQPRPTAQYDRWGTTFGAAADVTSSVVDQEAVLVKLGSGRSYTLNAVGTIVWELLDGQRPLGAVLTALGERFDAPERQLRGDLIELVAQLRAEGLIEERR